MALQVIAGLRNALLSDYQLRLERLQYSPHTRKVYLQAVRRLYSFLPDVPLDAITPEHIERYLWDRPRSPASIWTELENVRAFFTWLVKRGRLSKNPCDSVERPRKPDRFRAAPTWEDFCAIRALCLTLEEQVVVELLYFSGVRVKELTTLKERNVDLQTRRLRVIGKFNRERYALFPERTAVLLREKMTGDPEQWVLASEFHAPYARGGEWINARLAQFARDAALPYHLTAHVLRHGFVRLMKTRGVPIEVAARLAGHRDIRTTANLYGRLDVDDLQGVYDAKIGT